jgi:hypothetical protein
VPAAIWALAESNSSLITTTTPLLKSFVLQFTWTSAQPVAAPKPLVVLSRIGRQSDRSNRNNRSNRSNPPREPTLGSRRGSNLSEHEKPTAASSSGGEARPGTGENQLLV